MEKIKGIYGVISPLPFCKWCRLLRRSSQPHYRELLTPRYCRSVWGAYSYRTFLIQRRSSRRWLSVAALVSCCCPSPSTSAFSSPTSFSLKLKTTSLLFKSLVSCEVGECSDFFFFPFFFPPFKRDGGSGVVVKWSGLGKVNLIQSASVNGHGLWGKLRGWATH